MLAAEERWLRINHPSVVDIFTFAFDEASRQYRIVVDSSNDDNADGAIKGNEASKPIGTPFSRDMAMAREPSKVDLDSMSEYRAIEFQLIILFKILMAS